MSFNSLPTFEQSLTEGRTTSKVWYFFWKALYNGMPPGGVSTQTVGTSPATLTAPSMGFFIVQGGTVSLVQFSRDGNTNYTTGQISGCFPVSSGDRLIITYTVAPTVTFIPQ